MKDGPNIAGVAALLGDPARANMLTALLDGRALTVSELAQAAGVGLPTASGHLANLEAARLVLAEKQGRHRYFRLSGPDVAGVLEGLMDLAQRTGAVRVRTGPRDEALRTARVCYDHMAGRQGVAMMDALVGRGLISEGDDPAITESGQGFFEDLGIDLAAFAGARRPVCRRCLDWSERRSHLGGALGARLLDWMGEKTWVKRADGRVLTFTPAGSRAFAETFGPAN